MVKSTVESIPTENLLVAVCRLEKSNLSKKAKRVFADELYTLYTLDEENEATFYRNLPQLKTEDILGDALKRMNLRLQFGRLDGVRRIIYQTTKLDLLAALQVSP